MSFQKMYGLRGPSGLNMVNQAFIIVIAYRPRRRRRRKIPGIGRYPMGPTINHSSFNDNMHSLDKFTRDMFFNNDFVHV